MNSNIRFISLVGVIALLTAGCSSAPQQEPASTETPAATYKATEVCIINETETPIEIIWKSANMRSDGDKTGRYAITKSNSGKVCGLGSSTGFLDVDVLVAAGNILFTASNEAVRFTSTRLWFYDESSAHLCRSETSYYRVFRLGDLAEYSCGATNITVERQADTDYKNFLVTFKSAETFTPPLFYGDIEFPPPVL